MAPGTSSKDAYVQLKRARNLDQSGVFREEIGQKLASVAPKAAASFLAAKNYSAAKEAVGVAEANGGGGSTTQSVRQNLEQQAASLLREAQSQMGSDSARARDKLKTVQQMVDSKSPSYQKAAKLLASR
jgi:hypothetical protein